LRQQQWSIASFQRRFASDDAATQAAASDAPENFSQTAAEAPVDEDLTPAKQAVQAAPTDADHTVGADALEAAVKTAEHSPRDRKPRTPREPRAPNNMLYIGNLYYEVTADQLKRVFSRFGDIESVKIVYDNRGLSRG
jgi:nucleolin